MIQKLSHTSIYVLDQDKALDFYTRKLDLEVRADAKMGDIRWLTVGPKNQPELEMVLMPIDASPMMDAQRAARMRELVQQGSFGVGVFETDDIHAAYKELKRKGVEFISSPAERPYGIEAIVKDPSGNWFSLTQRKKG
ncbi:MAG: VOC family protein [Myxococcaceae bacterium]|nr:VOC family protein [Myxococcaceae bacterium]MCI0673215.1 VOC family protein [Myxococcaceae bacterium]